MIEVWTHLFYMFAIVKYIIFSNTNYVRSDQKQLQTILYTISKKTVT